MTHGTKKAAQDTGSRDDRPAPSYCRPERVRTERYIALFLFAFSFLYLCVFRRFTSVEPDEGIILQGAQRILSGQVLYRDFFSFYTPGSYYALALVFRTFGNSMLVARTALGLIGAMLSLITYLLARRMCSRTVALAMAVIATFTTLPYRYLILHNWDSTLWACLSIYCAVLVVEHSNWRRAFALGSCASLTVLFEQSKGAGLCLGLAFGFLLLFLVQERVPILTRVQILGVGFGFSWPFLFTWAYFASQHASASMLSDWLWPLHHYSTANHVPYGYQNWSDDSRHLLFGTGSLLARAVKILAISPSFWIPALPFVAAILLVYGITRTRRKQIDNAKAAYYLIVLAAFLGLALTTTIVRPDIIHFMYLQPLNCLVLAWLVDGTDISGRLMRSAKNYVLAYIVIAFGLFGLAPLLGALSASNQVATRRGLVKTSGQESVVDYVEGRVPAGGTIFVYPYLPLYYYLTGTIAPSRYDYFQPGMHTRQQADEMIEQLAARRVNVVLFEITFPEKIPQAWPDTPLASVTDDAIADYILRNYRPCKVLRSPMNWRFLFMIRKDLACP